MHKDENVIVQMRERERERRERERKRDVRDACKCMQEAREKGKRE